MTEKSENPSNQTRKRHKDKNPGLSGCECGRCRNFKENYEVSLRENLNIEYK